MLEFSPRLDPLVLIEDRFLYFFSLAVHALERDDYTPLFFIPLPGEEEDSRTSWLHGYSMVSWKFWDMWRCHRIATHKQIIGDGKIKPMLETVGNVEWFELYDVGEDAESVIDYIAEKVVRVNGGDTEALCEAVHRIVPLDERKGVNMRWKDAKKEDASDTTPRYNIFKLQNLLEEYTALLDIPANQRTPCQRRLELAKKLNAVLKMTKKGKHARESRLETAAGEAE